MSESCNSDCSSCKKDCESRKDFKEKLNEYSSVKKVIGIVSGKGGVGKSLITSMLATLSNRKGYKTAILDADITGPSIPKMFGLKEKAVSMDGKHIMPVITKKGIEVMSINLLLEDDRSPVIWRGPILAGTVKQFWSDVVWNDLDFMYVDMPPGTGDVPLTVFQSLPISAIVVVASPQDLVSLIVEKAVKMAEMMKIPVLALVENMSYIECPDCKKKIKLFGDGHTRETAERLGIENVFELPINSEYASLCDKGLIELFEGDYLDGLSDLIEKV